MLPNCITSQQILSKQLIILTYQAIIYFKDYALPNLIRGCHIIWYSSRYCSGIRGTAWVTDSKRFTTHLLKLKTTYCSQHSAIIQLTRLTFIWRGASHDARYISIRPLYPLMEYVLDHKFYTCIDYWLQTRSPALFWKENVLWQTKLTCFHPIHSLKWTTPNPLYTMEDNDNYLGERPQFLQLQKKTPP